MGSIFGLGYGLLERKGFKGSFESAASYAKAFAVSLVVNHLVRRFMKLLRGKDGSINRSLAAGCSAGVMNYILGPDP